MTLSKYHLHRLLPAALLSVAGVFGLSGLAVAEVHGEQVRAIDVDGSLTEAELEEHARLLLMADPQPPVPVVQGAFSAAVGQLGFSLITGGSGSGQDMARMRED